MIATTFEITDKRREYPLSFADSKDFYLRESGQIDAVEILNNPHITLYTLDFDNGRAVFVETAPDSNLSHAPFYYMAQYEHAQRALTVSFDTMIQLAQSVTVDDQRLVFIHSVGRSGSTLASQIFAQVEGVVNISEPDALTMLLIARYFQPDNEAGLKAILDATVRLLCKTEAQTAWVIKGRSFVIELGDWLHQLYPQTHNLFLYRHAETFLKSSMNAYFDTIVRTEDDLWAMENELREYFTPVTPLLAQYDASQHLSSAGMLTLAWLSVMERTVLLQEMGVDMLPIRYTNWHAAPRETAVAMLDYCGCRPSDMTAVYETLTKDSQAGTYLSQEAVQRHESGLRASDLQQLNEHLQNHAFIQTADYEVANTLKL